MKRHIVGNLPFHHKNSHGDFFMQNTNDSNSLSVGTLKYTLPQLLLVSAMLLLARQALATVCYTIVPTVTPLILDKTGANPAQIAIIASTIPYILSFVSGPFISTISDRTRSRWGRRMPYLILPAPLLALSVVLLGFSGDFAQFFASHFPNAHMNWGLLFFTLFYLLFQVVFQFPGTIQYYLEPDVMPQSCFGRFMASISICNALFGALFNYWLLKPSVAHMKIAMPLFGVLFLAIYVLQFFVIKEGKYPEVEKPVESTAPWYVKSYNYFAMFFRQCFSYKIYIALAFCVGMNAASNICREMFNVLFATKELGIDIGVFGKINAIGSIIAACLIYFFGKLMDRTHPMLIYFIGGILVMIVNVFGFFFVHSEQTYMVIAICTKLMYAFQGLANIPMLAKLLPLDKFGQYASGNNLVRDLILIVASSLAGYITKCVGTFRTMFVWDFIVTGLAMWALVIVYHEWKRHGGRNYVAPQSK